MNSLTVGQLETAAADLRNAALVVTHAGYARGRLLELETGHVCALGAIEFATCKKMIHDRFGFDAESFGVDSMLYRCDNAVAVFADFVPSALCYACNDEEIEKHAADCTAGQLCLQPRESYDKVTHYNDAHCVSPDLLINLLGLAADRALDVVHERRTILTGDRLPALV